MMNSGEKTILIGGTPFFREKMDGIGRFASQVLLTLSAQHPEWRFKVVGFQDEYCWRDQLVVKDNMEAIWLPFSRAYYKARSLFAPLAADKHLAIMPDIYLALDFTFTPWIRAPKKAVVIHDLAFRDLPQTVARRNRLYLSREVPRSLLQADAAASVSEFTQSRLRSYYQKQLQEKEQILIPNGVDERFFSEVSEARKAQLRTRYQLPERFLLAVGTLEPRKNLSYLLKAFALLPEQQQRNYPLVLVGKAGWGGDIISSSSYVQFTGYVEDEDLPAIYHLADAFVFPSLYEGFGIPVLEAMAAGTSVLSTDIDPVKEFAGDTIRYVPLDDLQVFAQALTTRSTSQQLGAARRIAQVFSWQHSVKQLEQWIENV